MSLKNRIGDRVVIASVSGGKDSTATCLYLREQGIPFQAVFCNTGWENRDTYEYLSDYLPGVIGPIHHVAADVPVSEENRALISSLEKELGFESAMVRLIVHKGLFPSRLTKFCTHELKLKPIKQYFDGLDAEPVSVVGVRAAESKARANLNEWEYSPTFDAEIWRPIIHWTEQDVIDIHTRHNVLPNPGYLKGSKRVGCWPCIYSSKDEIKRLSQDDARVSVIRQLETHVGQRMTERMAARGTTPKQPAAFFYGKGGAGCVPIDKVCQWSRTKRGGRQFELFGAPAREQGCMRWGLCDVGGNDE